MRVPFVLTRDTRSRHALGRHFAQGGSLPHYQEGTGFFGNLLGAAKRFAVPVLKSLAKEALPMVGQAVSTALSAKGPVKNRLKNAAQSVVTKNNLINLGRAAVRPVI